MNNEEFAQKNTCCLKKVLVTGASGFIGSFLVEGGLEREMQKKRNVKVFGDIRQPAQIY